MRGSRPVAKKVVKLPESGPFVIAGRGRAAAIVVARPLPRALQRSPGDLAEYLNRLTGHAVPVVQRAETVKGAGLRIHL